MASSLLFRWLFLLSISTILFLSWNPSVAFAADEDDIEVTDEEETKGEAAVDDEDEFEEEDDGAGRPHSGVRTLVLFPDFKDKRFHIASKVVALVGLHNKASTRFNVTAIGAHFQSPYDLNYYIQNFTVRDLSQTGGQIIEPFSQATLEYIFAPDKNLEPIEFWLSGWIEYNSSEGVVHRSTWFNGTVNLIEKDAEFDIRNVFRYFLLLSGVGLVVYVGLNFSQSAAKPKKTEAGSAPRETTDDDWGTAYTPAAVARRAGARSSRKTKPDRKSVV